MDADIKEVAVVTSSYKLFIDFEKENKNPNEKFIPIMKIEDVLGRVFSSAIYLHRWYDMQDAYEIKNDVIARIR